VETGQKRPTPRKTSKLAQHVRATLKTGQYVEETPTYCQNVETGQKRPTPRKTSKLAQHVRATLKTGQHVDKTAKTWKLGKTRAGIPAAAEKWPFSLPRQECTPPSQAEGQGSGVGVRSPGIVGGGWPNPPGRARVVFYGQKHVDLSGIQEVGARP